MRHLILLACFTLLAAAQTRVPVWIDSDPSAAPGGHEVDDAVALLQAFGSPELDIRGVSIVFGNTDLDTASRIGREITAKFGPRGLAVHDGAARSAGLGIETEASRTLARELKQARLTILALGPLTNVATVVRNHPELAAGIAEVVAVAGRRPGQRFTSGPAQKIPFRDLNFELDPEAFRVLLAAGVPIVLTPWEISSKVWLTRADLEVAAKHSRGVAWLLPAANDWLLLWRREFGTDGFNPFDALAVGYLVDRADLECGRFSVSIEKGPDDTSAAPRPPIKSYLLVRPESSGGRTAVYCFDVRAGFRQDLLKRLARGSER